MVRDALGGFVGFIVGNIRMCLYRRQNCQKAGIKWPVFGDNNPGSCYTSTSLIRTKIGLWERKRDKIFLLRNTNIRLLRRFGFGRVFPFKIPSRVPPRVRHFGHNPDGIECSGRPVSALCVAQEKPF